MDPESIIIEPSFCCCLFVVFVVVVCGFFGGRVCYRSAQRACGCLMESVCGIYTSGHRHCLVVLYLDQFAVVNAHERVLAEGSYEH